MGYFVNEHIKKYAKGKTILSIVCSGDSDDENDRHIWGETRIIFTDGTFLKLNPHIGNDVLECGCIKQRPTIIVNPYKADGEVEMS
jgi:hypothetical protein